jgi:hypothetical protein
VPALQGEHAKKAEDSDLDMDDSDSESEDEGEKACLHTVKVRRAVPLRLLDTWLKCRKGSNGYRMRIKP